jgi:23S rRNA pseudouridine955/2504/2580 synthase
MASIETVVVEDGEAGGRLDRFLKRRCPGLNQGQIEKWLRSGQVRVDGARAKSSQRVEAGQAVRIPPHTPQDEMPVGEISTRDAAFVRSLVMYEDDDLIAFNKPVGLAVQGGTKTTRHLDGLLVAFGTGLQKPRLVHRLDRDTSGVIVVGKSPAAAAHLAGSFAKRRAEKTYIAIVYSQPNPTQGTINMNLVKGQFGDRERMRKAEKGEAGSERAVTRFSVLSKAGGKASLVALSPHTGRTHQLRAHMAEIGHPILGDPKYGTAESEGLAPDLKLQLHAMALRLPHPRGHMLDLLAPPSPELKDGFLQFGFTLDEIGQNVFDILHETD